MAFSLLTTSHARAELKLPWPFHVDKQQDPAVINADGPVDPPAYSTEYFSGVTSLALRTARIISCQKTTQGRLDASEQVWYMGDNYSAWATAFATDFQSDKFFPRPDFVRAFEDEMKEKMPGANSSEARVVADAFADYLESTLSKKRQTYSGATSFLKQNSSDAAWTRALSVMREFEKKNAKRIVSDKTGKERCEEIRADHKFWENTSFRAKVASTPPSPSLATTVAPHGADKSQDPASPPTDPAAAHNAPAADGASEPSAPVETPVEKPQDEAKKPVAEAPMADPATLPKNDGQLNLITGPALDLSADSEMRKAGYYLYDPNGGSLVTYHYGTDRMQARIQRAGKVLASKDIVMSVGDLGTATGGNGGRHKGHKGGKEVDLRLVNKDGIAARGTVSDDGYDRDKTFEMIKAMIDADPKNVTKIFINDSALRARLREYMKTTHKRSITISECPGHGNHVHMSYAN